MIRLIKYEDIKRIVELENDVWGTTLGEKMLEMAVRSTIAYYYVYEENNNILGYISTMIDGDVIEIFICDP